MFHRVGQEKINCKNCGNSCDFGQNNNYCPKCGMSIIMTSQTFDELKNLDMSRFWDILSYYYNNNDDKIISKEAKNAFNEYIENTYSKTEAETLTVINSALKSGYSARLAEEKIAGKIPSVSNGSIEEVVDKAKKFFSEESKDSTYLELKNSKLFIIAVYLASDNKFKDYFIDKKNMNKYFDDLVSGNLELLIPKLRYIYEGKTLLHSLNGVPRYWEKPIKFDNELNKSWQEDIVSDVILGYCTKIAEEFIS